MDREELPIVYSAGAFEYNPPFEVHGGEKAPYLNSVDRVLGIIEALDQGGFRNFMNVTVVGGMSYIEHVHGSDYLDFLAEASKSSTEEKPLIPSSHPYGRFSKATNPEAKLGKYIKDTYTPLIPTSYKDAIDSALCAIAGAELLLEATEKEKDKKKVMPVYSLTRPPGHHAGREFGMGYCLINNAVVAVDFFLEHGAKKVGVIDFDIHHGNGTADLLYNRPQVKVVDIHADPSYEYPGYSGYKDGRNSNLPFPAGVGNEEYEKLVQKGLKVIRQFKPDFLVVSAGFDTHKDDPSHSLKGESKLTTEYYQKLGREIRSLGIPVLVVQEGGYELKALGANVASFLVGLTD